MARKKETVESLREKIKDWETDFETAEDRRIEAHRHCDDLQAKLKVALDRLEAIASGFHYPSDNITTNDSEKRARKTASIGLMKIAQMQERKA